MTRAATEFVGAITFEALTGRPVHAGMFEQGRALDHIALARSATALVVAPATADFLARAATGQADDLLTSILLATTAPVLLVPAMNDHMWAHAQTKHNVTHLTTLGYRIVISPRAREPVRDECRSRRRSSRTWEDCSSRADHSPANECS
jgi:phosphopantothenoylcysteine decarboxylase/phosphopantothenate--cysteine ligase